MHNTRGRFRSDTRLLRPSFVKIGQAMVAEAHLRTNKNELIFEHCDIKLDIIESQVVQLQEMDISRQSLLSWRLRQPRWGHAMLRPAFLRRQGPARDSQTPDNCGSYQSALKTPGQLRDAVCSALLPRRQLGGVASIARREDWIASPRLDGTRYFRNCFSRNVACPSK